MTIVVSGGASYIGAMVRHVVSAVRAVSGVNLQADERQRRAGDPASVTATGQKARHPMGWVP